MLQLDELMPVDTPLGPGYAMLIESGGHDNYWTVILDNGALVTFRQKLIRVRRNYTLGRRFTDAEMRERVDA